MSEVVAGGVACVWPAAVESGGVLAVSAPCASAAPIAASKAAAAAVAVSLVWKVRMLVLLLKG